MILTCFECERYTEVKDSARHEVPWSCSHKKYRYNHETSAHEDMDEVQPDVKEFDPSYYQAKDVIVYPLDMIRDLDQAGVEAGEVVQLPDELRPHRAPEQAEISGVVRHWDRVEVFVSEVSSA